MKYLSIKNFSVYQHYKDRRPPWIKLHASMLDDYEFVVLPDATKCHLMLLWVLASQMDNRLPYDLVFLTGRIHATDPIDLEELVLRGFLEPYEEERAKGKREDWASRHVSAQLRATLLSSAQHTCVACGAQKNLEIDHIIPISQGGSGDPQNLQVLCRPCNRRKRARLTKPSAQPRRSKSLRSSPASALLETETETETEQSAKCGGWAAEGAAWASENIAEITPGRFGGQFKATVRRHGWPKVFAALKLWAKLSPAKSRKLSFFLNESVHWIEMAAMPTIDPVTRELTEVGKLAIA